MFQTILNAYDVFRTDLYIEKNTCENKAEQIFFSTNPNDYVTKDGFYF